MSFTTASADPTEVARLLRDSGADPSIAPPGWSAYFESLVEALLDRLSGYSLPMRDFLAQHREISAWITWGLLAVIVLIAVILVVEILRRRARRVGSPAEGPHLTSGPMPAARDAAAWRAELERRLGLGQRGPALEALWWWFALSVAAEVPESCTSRELVSRVGRAELAAPARELDRVLYGPRRPQMEELRTLVHRLEQVLGDCKPVLP